MTSGAEKNTPYDSMEELLEDNSKVLYKEIDGFKEGRSVWIASLMAEDMLDWAEGNEADKDKQREAGLRLIAKSLVKVTRDAEGNVVSAERISKDEKADVARLRKVLAPVTNRITNVILEFNNMTPKQQSALKNV